MGRNPESDICQADLTIRLAAVSDVAWEVSFLESRLGRVDDFGFAMKVKPYSSSRCEPRASLLVCHSPLRTSLTPSLRHFAWSFLRCKHARLTPVADLLSTNIYPPQSRDLEISHRKGIIALIFHKHQTAPLLNKIAERLRIFSPLLRCTYFLFLGSRYNRMHSSGVTTSRMWLYRSVHSGLFIG